MKVKDILDNLKIKLERIQVVNGFNFDVQIVEEARFDPFKEMDLPAITYVYTNDRLNRFETVLNQRVISLNIEFYGQTTDENLNRSSLSMIEDINKALHEDVNGNYDKDFGGLADFVNVEDYTPLIAANDEARRFGAVVELDIYYTTNKGDLS